MVISSSNSLQRLTQFGLLSLKGTEVRAFLQGQLSNDLDALSAERTQLACCNSAQGRVQAIVTLIDRGAEGILALLPRSMIEQTHARLRKYVMRSKVSITDATNNYAILSSSTIDTPAANTAAGAHHLHADISYIRWRDPLQRWLLIAPLHVIPAFESLPDGSHAWHASDIRAGLPQIYPATHESFIAQMLNLDVLGAISFTKGCYTGQEIIARTHYLGAIKRRMFRLHSDARNVAPGTRVLSGEQHAGDVVDAVETAEGTQLLAVLSLAQQDATLTLATQPPAPLTKLSLPYSLTAPTVTG